jgi:radical SAM/Cys-rich protein
MELMDKSTINAVADFGKRAGIQTIDITGGAPELHPGLSGLIERLSSCSKRISLRSNLSVLEDRPSGLIHLFKEHRVAIVASLPSLNQQETDSQRGKGIFRKSIEALKKLNSAGYGKEETGLELNLISNPTGPYLPAAEPQMGGAFRSLLQKEWGIVFNNLFIFGLTPLGRFRRQLLRSGGFGAYMETLVSNFDPQNVEGLMCRSLLSVDWSGYLYDCDFNLAARLPINGRKTHILDMAGPPEPGSAIITSDHCYACAAGTGFT